MTKKERDVLRMGDRLVFAVSDINWQNKYDRRIAYALFLSRIDDPSSCMLLRLFDEDDNIIPHHRYHLQGTMDGSWHSQFWVKEEVGQPYEPFLEYSTEDFWNSRL